MIKLSRLNASEFWINQDHIVFLERTPETIVTLSDGKKLTVKETPEEVVEKVLDFHRRIVPPVMDQADRP
ncbi:MAG TPA: flagellar FlbD family protein [bacterium]|jgi:flagellar protein FlbD|nr:flagellar FlbD family protein [bacterium]